MPAFFLEAPDILPLPSLRSYTIISVLILSCCVWYAFQVTSEPDWKINATFSVDLTLGLDSLNRTKNTDYFPFNRLLLSNETSIRLGFLLDNFFLKRFTYVLWLMFHEPLCVWAVINMAYCCLILVGKVIQKLVFGELRVSEQQHIKDKFWNFIFYKFLFIFGVMNVPSMDEVVLWCSWFSVLGFLSLLAQLCKDRFEYLSFSPMTPKWTHLRLLLLLLAILTSSFSLFIVCIAFGFHAGINTFAFMAAECTLVAVRTLYVFVRYAIHLWDLNYEGVWENRASYAYYTEFFFELTLLFIDLFHHIHMLLWSPISLSMASLVILMQLRFLFYEIQRRIRKHKNYLQVVRLMETNFPMATTQELENSSDDCAICWDKMESARKLPCSHLFHNSCLRSWLEQDTSCPTCRTSLKNRIEDNTDEESNGLPNERDNNRANIGRTNFFHFDGPRYASWLPSVSVEVTRPHSINIGVESRENQDNERSVLTASQLENMAYQVIEWFPHIPLTTVIEDLRVTRSVDLTVENILDGRMVIPPNDLSRLQSNASSSSSLSSSLINSITNNTIPSSSASNSTCKNGQNETKSSDLYEDDLNSEEVYSPSSRSYGGHFSKSPEEREMILAKRKDKLFKVARKSYLAKRHFSNQNAFTSNQPLDDCD